MRKLIYDEFVYFALTRNFSSLKFRIGGEINGKKDIKRLKQKSNFGFTKIPLVVKYLSIVHKAR